MLQAHLSLYSITTICGGRCTLFLIVMACPAHPAISRVFWDFIVKYRVCNIPLYLESTQ